MMLTGTVQNGWKFTSTMRACRTGDGRSGLPTIVVCREATAPPSTHSRCLGNPGAPVEIAGRRQPLAQRNDIRVLHPHAQPFGLRHRTPTAALNDLRIFADCAFERLHGAGSQGRKAGARHRDGARGGIEPVAPFARGSEQRKRRLRLLGLLPEGNARQHGGQPHGGEARHRLAPCQTGLLGVPRHPPPLLLHPKR